VDDGLGPQTTRFRPLLIECWKTQEGCQSLRENGGNLDGGAGGAVQFGHVKIGVKWVRAGQSLGGGQKGSTTRLFAVSIREDRSSSTRPAGQGEAGVLMDAAEFGHET
jgi:hypothetical protein